MEHRVTEHRGSAWRRRAGGAAVAVALSGLLVMSAAVPAGAVPPPPPNPSDQQIQASQNHAQASAAQVGKLSGQVSTTQAKIRQLQDAMELKAELAMKARVDLEVARSDAADAKKAATRAQHAATQAGTAIVTAKQDAAKFAAASFRQGSVLGSMTALLDASSMDQLLARQQMIDQVSDTQLGVLSALESARTSKANLDSKAKAALDAAKVAQDKAQQAKVKADAAQAAAARTFQDGQQQLAALEKKLTQQQADYQAALNKVADLKGQRDQYNAWVAAKRAEDQRLAEQAALQAAQARQALKEKRQADQRLAELQAAKSAAVAKEKTKQAKLLAEKIAREKAAREKAAREKAAREKAAREAAAREKAEREAAANNNNGSSGSNNQSS
jgi:hypothetical protein